MNKTFIKYVFLLCVPIIAVFLIIFLNIGVNSAYSDGYKHLNRLLKKYDIGLQKPKYIRIKGMPKKIRLKKSYPAVLKKKVSLAGKGSVRSALMLLSREINIPIIIHRGFPNKLQNEVYYDNLPLYKVLDGLVTANGFKYTYHSGVISVYATEEKIFHISRSDLVSSFSSVVGMSRSNGQSAGKGQQSSRPVNAAHSAPSGSLSLTLSESYSFYSIISKNIKEMLTKSGKYFINPKDGLVWVRDRVSNVKAVSDYIKGINKSFSRQVLLKVEVIDVSLSKGFQMGINWNLLFKQAFRLNIAGVNAVSISAPLASENGINNAPYIEFAGSGSSKAIMDALKTQGSADIISQPRLILMDGQTRLISSGTVTPYISSIQTIALSLSQTETYPVISQMQTGLAISFTPHINFKNHTVSVTLSLIDNIITGSRSFTINGESFSNPIIETKSLSDTVNVKSGSTILVGGIITAKKERNTYEVPLLAQIPFVGNLFKSENDTTKKEDLLIMLTIKIIK